MTTLLGVRLGKHERQILLQAGPPRGENEETYDTFAETRAFIPAPRDGTPAQRKAQHRATRKLRALGLVETVRVEVMVENTPPREFRKYNGVLLTDFGAVVVEHLREVLETSQRIRWTAHLGALKAAMHQPTAILAEKLVDDLSRSHREHPPRPGDHLAEGGRLVLLAFRADLDR